jgi:hypothetical protein
MLMESDGISEILDERLGMSQEKSKDLNSDHF